MIDKMMRAGFKFAPDKSVTHYSGGVYDHFDWYVEPVVAGYLRLEHARKKLERPIPVPICATPVILPGVGVVVGGFDGRVRLFDPLFTKTYWNLQLPAPIYAPLLWLPDVNCVVAADTGGTVACFSLKGKTVWTRMLQKPVYAALERLGETGKIIVSCFNGAMFILEPLTGEITAQAVLPRPWFADRAPLPASRDPYASPVRIGSDEVVVTAANTLTAFDSEGTENWSYDAGAQVRASPAACPLRGTLLAMGVDGRCHLLDSSDGSLITIFELGDKIVASAATFGGIAAIGTAGGAVFGVDMASGERLWSQAYGAPIDHTGFSLLPNGSFICTNERGNVVARANADGRFLWESSQLIGSAGHPPRIDTTPICAPNGLMYASSYDGALYAFVFREQS